MRRPSFLFGCKIRPGKTRISFGEKQISVGFRLGTRGLSVLSGSAGKKSETSEHKPNFGNKTAGRGSPKQGSGRPFSFFTALPEFVQARLGCLSFGADESCPDLIIYI